MNATEHQPVSSLRRRRLIGALLLLAVLAALGVAGLLSKDSGRDRLRQVIDELDANEPGWRLADLEAARAPVPEPKNSARLIVAVHRRLPPNWLAGVTELTDGLPPTHLLPPAKRDLLDTKLRSFGPLLVQARELAELPDGRHHIVYAKNPLGTMREDIQRAREVMALLCLDALSQANARDIAGALQSCRAAINAGRSIGDEPVVIAQLVRNGCLQFAGEAVERTCALGEPPAEELARLAELLVDEERHPGLLITWRAERATLHEVLAGLGEGRFDILDASGGSLPTDLAWQAMVVPWHVRRQLRRDHAELLSWLNDWVAVAKLPAHEQAAEEFRLNGELARMTTAGSVWLRIYHLLPDSVGEQFRRRLALVRCLLVLIGLERYRQTHGKWPVQLEQLRPELLKDIPLDPYDGKPLRYRKVADGVVVYSVGPNRADDGGRLNRGGTVRSGEDFGYQLWDTTKRRQPPVAAPEKAK